jgi:Fic/DOC family
MHPADCPVWDYATHPRCVQVLRLEIPKVIAELRREVLKTEQIAGDSRPIHGRIFSALTPPGYGYFAGSFRGENHRCLKFYQVTAGGDPRVGYAPEVIPTIMNLFTYRIRQALAKIDLLKDDALAQFTQSIRLACYLFELFLRIHPYANGNGHIARLIVWAVLGRYDRWPESWPVEPRPPDPPYTTMIVEYRNGNHGLLEEFMIKTVLGYSLS